MVFDTDSIFGLAYTPNGGLINPVPEPANLGLLLAVLSLLWVGFRRGNRTE